MNITIRPARKDDYKNLIELYGEFVENPERYKNPDSNSFYKVIKDKNSFILLGELNNNIIGFITFSKRYVVRYGRPIMEVEEFYVKPEYRRIGVGKKLKQHVINYAKNEDCDYIFIASSKDRIIAHKFYKALGFDQYAYHFRRKP